MKDKDQRLLLTKSFLQNKSTSFDYPKLFIRSKGNDPQEWTDFGVGPCLIRIGDSDEFILPEKEEHLVKDFDWKKTVEFTILVWADKIHEQNYKDIRVDWKETYFPVETTLTNTTGINTPGPKYNSTLKYIGKLNNMFEKKGFTINFNDPDVTPTFEKHDGAFPKDIGNLIKTLSSNSGINGEDILKRIRDTASSSYQKGRISFPSTHLFAAHFKMNYHTPEVNIDRNQSKEIKSIRPFGNIFTEDRYSDEAANKSFYKYSLRNIKTAGKVGLNEEMAVFKQGFTSTTTDEYSFSFQVPKNHTDIQKWKYLSKKEFEHWTNEKAAFKAPVLPQIIKK